jgi:hypothetical protein
MLKYLESDIDTAAKAIRFKCEMNVDRHILLQVMSAIASAYNHKYSIIEDTLLFDTAMDCWQISYKDPDYNL